MNQHQNFRLPRFTAALQHVFVLLEVSYGAHHVDDAAQDDHDACRDEHVRRKCEPVDLASVLPSTEMRMGSIVLVFFLK